MKIKKKFKYINTNIFNISKKYKYIVIYIFIIIYFLMFINNKVYCNSIENNNNYNENQDKIDTEYVVKDLKKDINIDKFIKEADKYSKDTLNLNIQEMLKDAIKGKIDNKKLFDSILDVIFKEFRITLKSFSVILIIILLNAIIKSISDNLENTEISEIIFIIEYILILTIILKDLISIITITNNTIYNLIGFCNSLFPILTTLMVMSGKIVSFTTLEPILLFLITIIANIIGNIIVPAIMVITIFSVTSNISDMIQLNKISRFIKSSIIWFLGILLTLFVGILTIEGSLSSSVDVVAGKTTKAAVSNLVPIVGKVLGDATETVLGATNLLKNAIGVVGVIIIISICIIPVIKLAILSITYSLLSNVCSIVADRKIVQVLSEFSGSFKLLLAILCSVATLLIIGITLVIKLTSVIGTN